MTTGAVVSTTRVAVDSGPQLPWESWLWIEMTWPPSASPVTVGAADGAVQLATGAAAPTVIAAPAPSAPSASRKYSAGAIVESPEAESSAVALTCHRAAVVV